jgi:hypothetical protein
MNIRGRVVAFVLSAVVAAGVAARASVAFAGVAGSMPAPEGVPF